MNSNNKKSNDDEICLLCGEWKENKSLVGRNCFKQWRKKWEKNEETSLIVWTFNKANVCCDSIVQLLEGIKKTFDEFKQKIKQDAYDQVKQALGGASISVEDFSEMLEQKKQKLWKEREGDKLYGNLKRTEARAQRLPILVQELKVKIEKFEQEQQKQEQQ